MRNKTALDEMFLQKTIHRYEEEFKSFTMRCIRKKDSRNVNYIRQESTVPWRGKIDIYRGG